VRWGAALAGAVVAVALALPWAVPQVPQALADRVTGDEHVTSGQAATTASPRVTAVEPSPRVQVVAPPDLRPRTSPARRQRQPVTGDARSEHAGRPVRLTVPALGVHSAVVPISGNSGSLLPPSDPQVLGWWREGAEAGAAHGATVITGHTVHTGGGSFDHLDTLRTGDAVDVGTTAGSVRYVVEQVRVLSTAALARQAGRIFALDGPGRLVLVTCDDWNGAEYLSNAVVVAAPAAG
jgi:LPXTG-site transpeptidase (sortase) family protein